MNTLSRSALVLLATLLLAAAPLAATETKSTADRPAQVVTTVAPKYPYLMRRAEAAAEVTVAFNVNAQGIVTEAKIVGSNNPDFITPTLEALKQWSFTPALKDGKPVGSRVQQTFSFSVQDQAAQEAAAQIASKKRSR